jgi:DNA invertase Pin-like site-specific DNA recombinase
MAIRLDAYIRVSQVGETRQSSGQQREAIERWAAANDVEIPAWQVDLDRSGGAMRRPRFDVLVDRVRGGETGGVVVAWLDRFSRASVRDALATVEEIRGHGGRVVALDLAGLDTDDPFGEYALTMMLALGRMQLRRIADSWDRARRGAIERGVQIGPIPFGYLPDGQRRLVVHPTEGEVVRQLFERKARGDSKAELTGWLDAVAPKADGRRWSHATVTSMLANRGYLGRVAHGRHVNENAHEPLVSPELWRRAHLGPTAGPARKGGYALTGLVRCASCGHRMGGSRRGAGPATRVYKCCVHYASGDCPLPVYVSSRNLEEEVAGQLFVHLRERQSAGRGESDAARLAVCEAQEALALYESLAPTSRAGRAAHNAGIGERERTLCLAENRLSGLLGSDAANAPMLRELEASWASMSWGERGQAFRAALDAVMVRRPAGRRARYPLAPRIRVLYRGEAPPELRRLATETGAWTWDERPGIRPVPTLPARPHVATEER